MDSEDRASDQQVILMHLLLLQDYQHYDSQDVGRLYARLTCPPFSSSH